MPPRRKSHVPVDSGFRKFLLDGVSNIIEIFLRMTSVVNLKILKLLQFDDVCHYRCYCVTEWIA